MQIKSVSQYCSMLTTLLLTKTAKTFNFKSSSSNSKVSRNSETISWHSIPNTAIPLMIDLEIEINKSMPLNYRRERRSVTQCYVFPSSPLEGWLQGKGESWGLAKCVTDEAGLSYQRCSCQFPTEKWWWGIGNSSFIDVCVLIKTSRLLIYRWLLTSLGAVSVSEITFELEIVLDFTFCSRD